MFHLDCKLLNIRGRGAYCENVVVLMLEPGSCPSHDLPRASFMITVMRLARPPHPAQAVFPPHHPKQCFIETH